MQESNYYLENNEPYAQPDHYNSSIYNQNVNSSVSNSVYQHHQQQISNADIGSSDTDTDSAPVIKRPILIRGADEDFLKNFPRSFITEESSICTYYTETQPVDVINEAYFTQIY